MHLLSVISLTLVLTGAPASASGTPPESGGAWVTVQAPAEDSWKARAIQGSLEAALVGMERIRLAESLQLKSLGCEAEDTSCITRALKAQGVAIWVQGKLENSTLVLRSFETWSGTKVAQRKISLGNGLSLTEFRHRLFQLIRPFAEIGGLLDQHTPSPALTGPVAPSAATPATGISESGLLRLAVVAGALALLFWIPPFATRKRVPGLRRWISLLSLVLPLLLFACVHIKLIPMGWIPSGYGDLTTALKYWIGGAAWASILLIGHRFAFSGLRGMERVSFFTIFPILRAWIFVSFWKAFVFSIALTPFLLIGLRVAELLGLGRVTSLTLAAPVSVLLGCAWYLVWIAYIAEHLDGEFSSLREVDRARWDAEVRRYFRGYLRRLNVEVNERIFEKIRFLPGSCETLLSYGGGLTAPRIVINFPMLRLALGDMPEVDQAIEGGFPDFREGTLWAKRKAGGEEESGGRFSLPEWLRPKRTSLGSRAASAAYKKPFNLHGATALGYVLPNLSEQTEALAADSREDFDALGELLTAHYAQFDRDQEELELDDTNPSHKDFLFGALLREQGVLELRSQFLRTFSLALLQLARPLPPRAARVVAIFKDLYAVSFSKYPELLADSFAALNDGRNHLAQYLFFILTGREKGLTARADATQLYAVARGVLAELAEMKPTSEDALPLRSTLRNRLIWLSEFFYQPLIDSAGRWMRKVALAAAGLTVFIVIEVTVTDSIRYHSVYVERMEKMSQKIQEQREKKAQEQKDGGH